MRYRLPRNAADHGIAALYHYQDFDLRNEIHPERLADILKQRRIYCSNPVDFNDPWDCKPYFDPELLNDQERQSAAVKRLKSAVPSPNSDAIEQALRTNTALLKELVHKFSELQAQTIQRQWGVYCLTRNPCSTLMWSHYSRDHKGICLEFRSDASKFKFAWEITYQRDYPQLLFYDADEYFEELFLVKSDVWSYEQEFRLICPRGAAILKRNPFTMEGNYLSIGDDDLSSIILGCQLEDEAAAVIAQLVAQHSPTVRVRKARRSPNSYRLVIDD